MSKPYTDADFSAQITEDRSWRLREISDLKTAITRADTNLRRVLLRGLVAICYAHWEGYVRFAARKYLEHVALRKFKYRDLHQQFRRNRFLPRLAGLTTSKTGVAERCSVVDDILNSADSVFSRVDEDLVSTKSNLNFDVLSDICLVCGVSTKPFADKATFIDVFLLKRRNAVAHGEETSVSIQDLDEITNGTVAIMRTFGDILENNVYMKFYKSA